MAIIRLSKTRATKLEALSLRVRAVGGGGNATLPLANFKDEKERLLRWVSASECGVFYTT